MRGDAWSERRRKAAVRASRSPDGCRRGAAWLGGRDGVGLSRRAARCANRACDTDGVDAEPIPPPPAVKRAGGRELARIQGGCQSRRKQSGCLACHRIGAQGRSGPGPALTHIGSSWPHERSNARCCDRPRRCHHSAICQSASSRRWSGFFRYFVDKHEDRVAGGELARCSRPAGSVRRARGRWGGTPRRIC